MIAPRSVRIGRANPWPGLLVPMHGHPWYYEICGGDGECVATLHLDEGVAIDGQTSILRVTTKDRVTTLWRAGAVSDPVASYFVGNAGMFATVKRVTLGDQRAGGYLLSGSGWRGSWLTDTTDGEHSVAFLAEGDPAIRYRVTPAMGRSAPLAIIALTAYILLEREAHGWAVATRLERRRRVRRDG